MKYKINLHAHSTFSDGSGTPTEMAIKAKELGFSCLVLTDHFYGHGVADKWRAMSIEKMPAYKEAIKEATKILPVIRGMEVPFHDEEVLVFGETAIDAIMKVGVLDSIEELKAKHECAVILCHPLMESYNEGECKHLDNIDGFEMFNSGRDWFHLREMGVLSKKIGWCNSDAHTLKMMELGHNLVNECITTEQQLIKYITSGSEVVTNNMGR